MQYINPRHAPDDQVKGVLDRRTHFPTDQHCLFLKRGRKVSYSAAHLDNKMNRLLILFPFLAHLLISAWAEDLEPRPSVVRRFVRYTAIANSRAKSQSPIRADSCGSDPKLRREPHTPSRVSIP